MSIADNPIAYRAGGIDQTQRRSWRRSTGAEDRVRARRQRAAVDGLGVAVSTAALITGGVWLALLGPLLIVASHTYGLSRTGQQGQHRSNARHTGGRFPRLQHR